MYYVLWDIVSIILMNVAKFTILPLESECEFKISERNEYFFPKERSFRNVFIIYN